MHDYELLRWRPTDKGDHDDEEDEEDEDGGVSGSQQPQPSLSTVLSTTSHHAKRVPRSKRRS